MDVLGGGELGGTYFHSVFGSDSVLREAVLGGGEFWGSPVASKNTVKIRPPNSPPPRNHCVLHGTRTHLESRLPNLQFCEVKPSPQLTSTQKRHFHKFVQLRLAIVYNLGGGEFWGPPPLQAILPACSSDLQLGAGLELTLELVLEQG